LMLRSNWEGGVIETKTNQVHWNG